MSEHCFLLEFVQSHADTSRIAEYRRKAALCSVVVTVVMVGGGGGGVARVAACAVRYLGPHARHTPSPTVALTPTLAAPALSAVGRMRGNSPKSA